jgi:hypothetical protein
LATVAILTRRFAELAVQAGAVEATKYHENDRYSLGERVNAELLLAWHVKARALLANACGPQSVHFAEFVEQGKPQSYRSSHREFRDLLAVFTAAREDYEGGYLNSVKSLVQAEVFGSEIEQARELHQNGYIVAAAVIAGVVLETTLRQICDNYGIGTGSLNKMNADLTKIGAYNLLVQKRITTLADIRNNAAHGRDGEFSADDVSEMIKQVENFVTDHI